MMIPGKMMIEFKEFNFELYALMTQSSRIEIIAVNALITCLLSGMK